MQINMDVKDYGQENKEKRNQLVTVMTNIKYLISIKEMIIDETKEHTFYRLEQQNQDIKKVY